MYHGTYEGQKTYGEVHGADKVHSTRVNMPKELFIARFKYNTGPVNKPAFMAELIKTHTVEEYAAKLDAGETPLQILKDANPAWCRQLEDKYHIAN